MEQLFKNYLFGKHVLVSDGTVEHPFEVIFALAKHFNIRITEGAELANVELIRFAEDRLGMYVPPAFYKNFPKSVRRLTREALLFDQLVHYTGTYGFGHTEEAGHSLFEENFDRLAFDEETTPKKFIIIKIKKS